MFKQKAKTSFHGVHQKAIAPLASIIVTQMTKNVVLFPAPPVPLADITRQIEALRAILATKIYNARSTELKRSIQALGALLKKNVIYVNGVAQGDKAILEKSGYPLSKERSSIGRLLAPKFVKISKGLYKGSFQVEIAAVKNAMAYLFAYTLAENPETNAALWGVKYTSKRRCTFKGFELDKKYKFAATGLGTGVDNLDWNYNVDTLFAQ